MLILGIELDKYCISWLRDRNEAKRRNCGRVKSEEPDDWPPLLWIYRLYACLTLFMSRDDIASMHNNRVLLAITRVRIASMILVWIRIIDHCNMHIKRTYLVLMSVVRKFEAWWVGWRQDGCFEKRIHLPAYVLQIHFILVEHVPGYMMYSTILPGARALQLLVEYDLATLHQVLL